VEAYLRAFDAYLDAWAHGSDNDEVLARAAMVNALKACGVEPRPEPVVPESVLIIRQS
jgi:hypothetical protein